MEAVGKDLFEEWMQRIMGRIDRLDGIISVLINKDASGVKYLDGERMYDNQDLCEMLRTSKRSLQRFRSEYGLKSRRISRQELLQGVGRVGVHQPEHGRSCTGRRESAEDKGRHREEITGQDQREERRQAHGKSLMTGNFQDEKEKMPVWVIAGRLVQ